MQSELAGINGQAQPSDPTQTTQTYAEAATKIWSEVKRAGGDVETVANQAATDPEWILSTLKQSALGSLEAPDAGSLIRDGAQLQTSCS